LKLINSSNTDVSNAITEYFGDLADVVFEDTGNPDAFQSAIKAVTPGGRICTLSITGKSKIEVDVDYITTRDITVVGVLASPNSFIPALNMIAAKKIDVESCISHRFPFEETPQALDFAKNSSSKGKIKVLIIKD
jgi:L-iditol 2-dehydrogenase